VLLSGKNNRWGPCGDFRWCLMYIIMCVCMYIKRGSRCSCAHTAAHTLYIPIRCRRATADPKLIYLTEKRRDLSTCLCTHTHMQTGKKYSKNDHCAHCKPKSLCIYIHIIGDRCMFIIPKRVEIDADGFPFGECYSLGCAFYQTEIYGDTYVINRKERILQYLCS